MNWGSICRICSCPAEYEVFAVIPTYLHGNSNEFLNWQKPINTLLEESTGLKVSLDDGLPHSICALCISYLKHAVNFREQTINNAMSLKAVGMLRQQTQKKTKQEKHRDKEAVLITAQDLIYSDEHQTDANLLVNNYHPQDKRQDKVRKQLLNNNFPTPQNIEQQMRYLNLLFDKDPNAGQQRHKQRNPAAAVLGYEMPLTGSGGDAYPEEEFQTATSSDDNENRGAGSSASQKHNIFSYKEKNFEEDDIMDMDELRSAITINIPESCKERKCRACFRRFMFEESYTEHMDTCIEYKFLTYIEEINRLLDIRRSKAVSPHEFIRRMIFCLRKTCEWLKLNCADMLLPDLLQNGDSAAKQQRAESDAKSSATSSGEQRVQPKALPNEKLAAKVFDMRNKRNKLTDFMRESKATDSILLPATKENDLNLDTTAINNLFMTPKPIRSRSMTPISISNNILYEIERSESRNSNQQANFDLSTNTLLKKPIAVLATNGHSAAVQQNEAEERLTFLEKLKQAACQTPPAACKEIFPATPQINVRKDLLIQPTPSKDASSPLTPMPLNLSFSARCNPCNILFETLASLEVHNAMHHNMSAAANKKPLQQPMSAVDIAADEERKRIIALFEEDDSADEAQAN